MTESFVRDGTLTPKIQRCVRSRMYYGFERRNACDVPVEDVKCGELPSGSPQEDVIAPGEHPDQGDVRECHNAGAVGKVAEHLLGDLWPAIAR